MTDQLLHSPADVLAQLVVDLGLGSDPTGSSAWPVYPTKEPDSPDRVITVYDTMGVEFGHSSSTGVKYYKAGVQLRVRADNPLPGFAKAESLAKTLTKSSSAKNATVVRDGTSYCVEVVTMGLVLPMPRTDVPVSKRPVFLSNGYITLARIN